MTTKQADLTITVVKPVASKLLTEVLQELEEQIGIPVLKLIKRRRVVVLVNGTTITDLMYKINAQDEIIVLPLLAGG